MTIKTIKLAFEQDNDPMFIGRINKDTEEIKMKHLLTLLEFSVINGTVSWTIRTETGAHLIGGSEMTKVPGTSVSLKPSTPLILHKRNHGLAPEFVFMVPSSFSIHPLTALKRKFPNSLGSLYKI